jgi:hypothetical protein
VITAIIEESVRFIAELDETLLSTIEASLRERVRASAHPRVEAAALVLVRWELARLGYLAVRWNKPYPHLCAGCAGAGESGPGRYDEGSGLWDCHENCPIVMCRTWLNGGFNSGAFMRPYYLDGFHADLCREAEKAGMSVELSRPEIVATIRRMLWCGGEQ